MENLIVTPEKISWKESKIRHGNKIIREYEIMKHSQHISISKNLIVKGEVKYVELIHVPTELIPLIVDFINKDFPPTDSIRGKETKVHLVLHKDSVVYGVCDNRVDAEKIRISLPNPKPTIVRSVEILNHETQFID